MDAEDLVDTEYRNTFARFILDRTHPQYAGGMALEDQAAVICEAAGPTGTNRDYLFKTVAHLRELGVEDPELFELERMVRARVGV